jgi:hypothetical protein
VRACFGFLSARNMSRVAAPAEWPTTATPSPIVASSSASARSTHRHQESPRLASSGNGSRNPPQAGRPDLRPVWHPPRARLDQHPERTAPAFSLSYAFPSDDTPEPLRLDEPPGRFKTCSSAFRREANVRFLRSAARLRLGIPRPSWSPVMCGRPTRCPLLLACLALRLLGWRRPLPGAARQGVTAGLRVIEAAVTLLVRCRVLARNRSAADRPRASGNSVTLTGLCRWRTGVR